MDTPTAIVLRAWKDESFRNSLTEAARSDPTQAREPADGRPTLLYFASAATGSAINDIADNLDKA